MKKYIGLTLGILLLLGVSAFFLNNRNPHKGLILIQETEHGVFYSPSADAGSKQVTEILSSEFDAHFMRLSKMFHFESEQKVPVHVYVDYEAFREMIGRDTEGTYDARDKTIKVYTPVDLEDPNTRKDYTDQVTHELVHAIIQQINPNVGRTKWLDEGTAYYASNQFEEEFASKINSGFAFLDFPALEQFRKPSYFNQAGGAAYFYSGTLIHYIVEKYGIETLNEIIRKPKKIEKILDTSIENLYADWESSLR
ncbi:hypothetical protein [Paenibacillus sp. DYY-L-2]|uniref:hypothetical protein n=1 Tax=Paenibacillus sp. DYY-L-2 TaxID=3447013 RepID=UPI003F50D344